MSVDRCQDSKQVACSVSSHPPPHGFSADQLFASAPHPPALPHHASYATAPHHTAPHRTKLPRIRPGRSALTGSCKRLRRRSSALRPKRNSWRTCAGRQASDGWWILSLRPESRSSPTTGCWCAFFPPRTIPSSFFFFLLFTLVSFFLPSLGLCSCSCSCYLFSFVVLLFLFSFLFSFLFLFSPTADFWCAFPPRTKPSIYFFSVLYPRFVIFAVFRFLCSCSCSRSCSYCSCSCS